jgi:hypothetical protein
MVTANWVLTCAGDREDVLAMLADYSRAAEWTPAVRSASKARARVSVCACRCTAISRHALRAAPPAGRSLEDSTAIMLRCALACSGSTHHHECVLCPSPCDV